MTSGKDATHHEKKTTEPTSPFYLYPSDSSAAVITQYVLKEENYDVWAKAIINALRAKNKSVFIDGSLEKAVEGSLEASMWEICNAMLVSWIFNTVDASLQPSVAYIKGAKAMWDDLKERFCIGNGSRIHQLKSEIATLKQDGMTIAVYYTKLKGMWDEFGIYSVIPICTCGAAKEMLKEREDEKTDQVLIGLSNSDFGKIQSQILGMGSLPSLNRVYAMVTQEGRHRDIARGKEDGSEHLAFSVQSTSKTWGIGMR